MLRKLPNKRVQVERNAPDETNERFMSYGHVFAHDHATHTCGGVLMSSSRATRAMGRRGGFSMLHVSLVWRGFRINA